MPLSRLENFLKNVQGNVIYVNPEELDATDDIGNTGNSRARPFKTIQRALLESARFSYQVGADNDKFDKTTIVVSPGVHYIDNRPGFQIDTSGNVTDVNGSAAIINQFSVGTNFDIQDPDNVLYQFNSIHGGVILPRGTSIVGQDLRKTKIKPKYVPQPDNDNIDRSAVFRVTGGCFFFGFTFFDADPADRVYRDYTKSVYSPRYSHHKLTCFEYADGVNTVSGKGNTDLDMYYAKLTLAYGTNSGRALPNYPANTDFQASVDEYRVVGDISQIGAIEISDIYSGSSPSSSVATPIVTVVTSVDHGFAVDSPILISGVDNTEYDGSYFVSQVINDTTFTYALATTPTSTANPSLAGKTPTVTIESDTVTSASPYIFNCSIRSVYGLNGMHADGDKATGFKSMVVAQFTGISLNKDDNAYVKYNTTSGIWQDQATLGSSVSLHTDGLARHKPTWKNSHIKVSNNSFIQCVSIFAIGYASHFVSETGGDMSITNSNSNFGNKALEADKFRLTAFLKDDKGYITSIVPPQKNFNVQSDVNYLPIDVDVTAGLSTDTKLYFYGYNQKDTVPFKTVNGGYVIGNKSGEVLHCNIDNVVYGANVLMPVPGTEPDDRVSAKKEYYVGRVSGINSITGNTFTLQENHKLFPGETVRIHSHDGSLPDGILYDRVYYAITDGLNSDQIQIATTYNNALAGDELTGINNLGGELVISSTVADKNPGDPGHPIQYDSTGWYVNVGAGNSLHAAIVSEEAQITPKTGSTFVKRTADNRSDNERIYRVKYVIPENTTLAAPPINGYTIEESSSVIDDTNYQNDSTALTSVNDLRTNTNIVNASWASNVGIVTTQYPHKLKSGHLIEINRLKSENNTTGADNSGFNGLFEIVSIDDSKTFRIGLNTNPGSISTITTNIPYTFFDASVIGSGRTESPYFVKKDFGPSYQIQDQTVVQEYKKDIEDGVYELTLRSYLRTPTVSPFSTASNRFGQDLFDLIPAVDLDNPQDDPQSATSYAVRDIIGNVETNDPSKSITKEGIESLIENLGVGIGITGATVSGTDLTINTGVQHNLNGIETISGITGGTNYGRNTAATENYFNIRLEGGSGKGATADVTVSAASTIASITLTDHGSGYQVGDTLTVRGVPFHAAGSDCEVTVASIDNRVGDAIQVVGVGSTGYNGLVRITSVPSATQIRFTGVADDDVTTSGGYVYHVGIATSVVNITHDAISGIATVQLSSDIGLRRGDQIVIAGCTGFSTVYNGTHSISESVGYGSSMLVNIGITSNAPAYTGVATAHGTGISLRSKGRDISLYGGVTTKLTSGITTTTTSISLDSVDMLRRGDYLLIDNEIVRISNNTGTSVIRGLLGTNAVPHDAEVAVKRIKVIPVENRRYSVLRASGHTFEYLGFGPGNYSTAMPQTQSRVLDEKEKILAQSTQSRGGFIVYTGMNDAGDFYIGNLKIDPSGALSFIGGVGGNTVGSSGAAGLSASSSATFNDLTVNNNFYSKGNAEFVDISLNGNRSGNIGKTIFLGIQDGDVAPTSNNDNILFRTAFGRGGYLGWVKTNETADRWKRFGPISQSGTEEHYAFDKVAIGKTFAQSELDVTGNVNVSGVTTATSFVGNGTIPVGGIIMWSGSIATIPTGWALCDGSNSTPDLRNRFVVAAADDSGTGVTFNADTGATSGNYAPDDTGGSVAHQLTVAEMPSHTHDYYRPNEGVVSTGSNIDIRTRTFTQTAATGGDDYHENRPPYYALAFIMRTV